MVRTIRSVRAKVFMALTVTVAATGLDASGPELRSSLTAPLCPLCSPNKPAPGLNYGSGLVSPEISLSTETKSQTVINSTCQHPPLD